jgi:hypothetical protein
VTVRVEDLRGAARDRYDTWRRLGLSESSALQQCVNDGLVETEPFDVVAATLRRLNPGLSESGARSAAVGRGGSESAARRGLSEALKPGSVSVSQQFDRLEEALARLSDEDCKLIVEAAAKRTASTPTRSGSKRIAETGR